MTELHDYQKRAVKHLHDNPRAALFMEMGLGKTLTVLSALTPEHLPALVIAPKRVAENVWVQERNKWGFDFSMAVAKGSPAQRKKVLADSTQDIVILGRDNTGDLSPNHGFRTIVLDELSGYKNRGSQRWKLTKALTKNARYVWGLTGTPAPNGLMDLWAQLFLLDRGERLETGITKFRSRYFMATKQLPNGVVIEWTPREEAEDRIYEKIEDICLSMRTKDYLELPPMTVNTISVPLPSNVMKIYNKLKKDLVLDMELLGEATYSAANAAVLTSKLGQVSWGFMYEDAVLEEQENGVVKHVNAGKRLHLHDEKVKAVKEIVEGNGSPVLVFYRFRVELDDLRKAIPEAKTIDEVSMADWNAGRVPVLLAHPASAGHGLNLQDGGRTIVWASLTWAAEEYEQANSRLFRQGQEHPVIVHHLIAQGTVDEAMQARLVEKKSVQDALMDHLK